MRLCSSKDFLRTLSLLSQRYFDPPPVNQLDLLNFDCYVIGVSSISMANAITFPLLSEAQLKQAALRKSHEVITVSCVREETAAFPVRSTWNAAV